MIPRTTPLAAILVALLALAALPHAAAENVDDSDGDRIADPIDNTPCTNGALFAAINTAGQGRVWCDASQRDIDYELSFPVTLVTGVYAPDWDGDGFPGEVTVQQQTWTVDPHYPTGFRTDPAQSQTIARPDSNDNNRDDPLLNTIPIDEDIIVNAAVGPDPDGDFLPTYVRLYTEKWAVDRGSPNVYTYESSHRDVPVDPRPNDNDLQTVLDVLGDAVEKVAFVQELVDKDHDGVADAAEPTICSSVEFDGLPQDGSCNGADYTPPGANEMTMAPTLTPGEALERADPIVDAAQGLVDDVLPLVWFVKGKVGVNVHTDLLP